MTRRWWDNDGQERFWCEITDRNDIGENLYCPQFNVAGKPFWSYSLINEIHPGDIVFHYSSPQRAVIGASIAAAELKNSSIDWTPHWTGEARKAHKKVPTRPAWIRVLAEYTPLPQRLTLSEIQQSQAFVRKAVEEIEQSGFAPMIFLQMYPGHLRALQDGYVTKMPSVFVTHFEKLRSMASHLSNSRVCVSDTSMAEEIITTLLEEVEKTSQTGADQSFVFDPELRKVIERAAVERASAYFMQKGFSKVEEFGKPFDLLCTDTAGKQLFVEVKGTTTDGNAIFLTANEIDHAKEHSDNTALYILSNIEIDWKSGKPIATAGIETVLCPWTINQANIKPLTFKYQLKSKLPNSGRTSK